MYISEHYGWDTNRLRRVAIRPHGFASVSAGAGGGEIVTRALLFEGRQLRLNYSTSAAGSLRVELQHESGEVIPGFGLDDMEPVYGDELDGEVSWASSGDVSALQGQPVRLRIRLVDADVFALRFV